MEFASEFKVISMVTIATIQSPSAFLSFLVKNVVNNHPNSKAS